VEDDVTRRFVLALALATAAASAAAQVPTCDALSRTQRAAALRLLESEHPYECCDDTIARCLEARPTCALAVRLTDEICRRVAAGQDEVHIRRALSRRARSMVGGGQLAVVDEAGAPAVGPSDAPVTLVVYACARCPYCSELVPELYRAASGGPLVGTFRMVFRTFPIRGHAGSTEAGIAFTAAAAQGCFWKYMLLAYARFDSFSVEKQPAWAAEAGCEPVAFSALMADPRTREALVASKREGLANGVEETPTLFINGRQWVGDLEAVAVFDAVAEEAARVRGEQWAKQ
jgi:protein-disulfide isomerase